MGNTSRIYEKLAAVQMEYAAPKDNYNSFGGYSYRSFETMLDTLKPLLSKYGLVLTTTNSLQECGGHVYIKSTCTLTDVETGESVSADSYAREDETPTPERMTPAKAWRHLRLPARVFRTQPSIRLDFS